jgi:hypothetical protein
MSLIETIKEAIFLPAKLFASSNIDDIAKALNPLREAQAISVVRIMEMNIVTKENADRIKKAKEPLAELQAIFDELSERPVFIRADDKNTIPHVE